MITEQMLDALRDTLASELSEKRYRHTVEVERMAIRLGELYAPKQISMLRAAALLHDLTKEYSPDRHLLICAQKGLPVSRTELYAPKTFHAKTAAALIPERFPEFADEALIGCVRWHTTGREGMTLCEKLIYLADYIDLSRTFADCVTLRTFFFEARPEEMSFEERMTHLHRTMILSFDMTVRGLLEEGTPISPDTVGARNELICRCRAEEQAATEA
ncbi:MAG: HD domain-containing protein [Ruminococcaceae bacterium]|nr:HD domain-containing protein [Oscillospiraceae bacterium]